MARKTNSASRHIANDDDHSTEDIHEEKNYNHSKHKHSYRMTEATSWTSKQISIEFRKDQKILKTMKF